MRNDHSFPVECSWVGFPDIELFILASEFLAEVFTSHAFVLSAVFNKHGVLQFLNDFRVGFVFGVNDDSSLLADRSCGLDVITSAHSSSDTGLS
jgi:hypothetical protein